MNFTWTALVATFISVAVFVSATNTTGGTLTLTFLGTVDGKSFFADNGRGWNWTQAGEYCQSMNMELGIIETTAQWNFLAAAFDWDTFIGWFWTGGRDSGQPSQFHWNRTDSANGNVGIWDLRPNFFQTCVAFYSMPFGNSYFRQFACSTNGYVLCET